MSAQAVSEIIEELLRKRAFDNWHGITQSNLDQHLVQPFAVDVDPDDLETGKRKMWIVLQERPNPTKGYVVVYDPLDQKWGIAEHVEGEGYILIVGAETFWDALDGM